MQNNKRKIQPDNLYHIYNRVNGNELLFIDDSNYLYFLKKYKQYISQLADTFCYCLMPNHFHILIKVKEEAILKKVMQEKQHPNLQDFEGFISKQFGSFFNAYAKAFNRQTKRKGSLFMQPFKRIKIEDEDYLKKLIHYIHLNPIKAKLCSKPEEWKYSSYNAIVSTGQTMLNRNAVIILFDDKENFIYCHKTSPTLSGIEELFSKPK